MLDCVSNAFRKGALEHIVKSRPKMALFTKLVQHWLMSALLLIFTFRSN